MGRRRATSLAIAMVMLSVVPALGFERIGYVSQWSLAARPGLLEELPVGRLTHVVYAFGAIAPQGTAALADPCSEIGHCDDTIATKDIAAGSIFSELQMLKARQPHLKLLIAFGGWNGSEHFSALSRSEESRANFANSVTETFFTPWPGLFDGVDIDWEYPVAGGLSPGQPSDRENLALLLEDLRTELDRVSGSGSRPELSVAVAATPGMIAASYPASLPDLVDRVQVMTYDYHAGEGLTQFNAPLAAIENDPAPDANLSASMAAWVAFGIPREKLVVGLPFYGRALGKVTGGGDGLLRPGDPAGSGEWSGDGIAYRDLVARRSAANFSAFRHAEAGVPYLYDEGAGIWISFDDACSIARKVAYAQANGFGGAMAWELGHDNGTLLSAMASETPDPECETGALTFEQ